MNGLANFIKSSNCRNVAFLTGAGVSVASGIPDFRSPGGMYDTLRPELLTATPIQRQMMDADPTKVVSWDIFQKNQFPYLEVRRPFIVGVAEQTWKMTLAHWFMRIFHDKGLLKRLYTQNIDGLDYQTGIPDYKVVSVHGTLGRAQCEFCQQEYPMDKFVTEVRNNIRDIYGKDKTAPKKSSHVLCGKCKKPGMKPATVLYGRSLPNVFEKCLVEDKDDIDLLIVMGSSLTVSPANFVVQAVRPDCVRVIINKEIVGENLGICYDSSSERDIFIEGSCDSSCMSLLCALDWMNNIDQVRCKLAPNSQKILKKF